MNGRTDCVVRFRDAGGSLRHEVTFFGAERVSWASYFPSGMLDGPPVEASFAEFRSVLQFRKRAEAARPPKGA